MKDVVTRMVNNVTAGEAETSKQNVLSDPPVVGSVEGTTYIETKSVKILGNKYTLTITFHDYSYGVLGFMYGTIDRCEVSLVANSDEIYENTFHLPIVSGESLQEEIRMGILSAHSDYVMGVNMGLTKGVRA